MTRAGTLAVLGDTPRFARALHVGEPNIGDRARLVSRFNDILDSRRLTNHGPYVEALENTAGKILGVEHCIAVCNGTAAIELMLRATGLKGEILVPSFTFVATAHAVRRAGLTPVFCDADLSTHLIDVHHAESLITDATVAVLGVHLWGQCHNYASLRAMAERNNLELYFDAAHAFGSSLESVPGSLESVPIGGLGKASAFSLHATKIINSFEGGLITTNDGAIADEVRLLSNFGFADYDSVVRDGTNAKMAEVNAAMALTSIESLGSFLEANRRNHEMYLQGIGELSDASLLKFANDGSNMHYAVLTLNPSAHLTRNELQNVLVADGVLARRYFSPGCHRSMPYSAERFGQTLLPVTDRLSDTVICLPTGSNVSTGDIAQVCDLIRSAFERASDVKSALTPLRVS